MFLFPLVAADTLNADTVDTLIRRDTFIKSPTVAAVRSAILPGWGQFYNGAYVKGLILGGLTLAATGHTVYRYVLMRREGGYSYALTTGFLSALILNVVVWGYTVADAFVDAYLYGFEEYRDTLREDLDTSKPPPSPQEPADKENEDNEGSDSH